MTAKEKYDKVFMDCFLVSGEALNEKFAYQSVPEWDSVGHMAMVAAIEDAFEIMLDTDDVIEFSSYTVGLELLRKYGIEL